ERHHEFGPGILQARLERPVVFRHAMLHPRAVLEIPRDGVPHLGAGGRRIVFANRVGIGNDLYGLCRGAASAAARWAATLTTVVAARAAAADEEQRGRHRSDRHLPNSHACLLDSNELPWAEFTSRFRDAATKAHPPEQNQV